jgi:WD40 repeat protein
MVSSFAALSGYELRHLGIHLHHAGLGPELRSVLLELGWMDAKLGVQGVVELLADYAFLPDDPVVAVLAGALRLSSRALAAAPAEISSQLVGRLARHREREIAGLLDDARARRGKPWLLPLAPSLLPPGAALLRTLPGHRYGIVSVAATPDALVAVAGCKDETVRVWDLDRNELRHTLTGHRSWVSAVALTADGKRAISGGTNGTVCVWAVENGESVGRPRVLRDRTGAVVGLEVRMREGFSGVEVGPPARLHDRVGAVVAFADGRRALSGGVDGKIVLWDLESGNHRQTVAESKQWITAMAVTASGQHAVCGGQDGTLLVWDLERRECLHRLTGHSREVSALAFDASGDRIASGDLDGTIRIWGLDRGEPLGRLTGPEGTVLALAFSADDAGLISGHGGTSHHSGGAVSLWDLAQAECTRLVSAPNRWFQSLALIGDRRFAVSGGNDGTVRVWDLRARDLIAEPTGHASQVAATALSSDARRAITADEDGTVLVWNVERGESVHALTGHKSRITSVAVTWDGRRGVTGDAQGTVQVWDLDRGQLLRTHSQPDDGREVAVVAISPTGSRVVSAHSLDSIYVWDLERGERRRVVTGPIHAAAVSLDCRLAMTSSNPTVHVWNLDTGREIVPSIVRARRQMRLRFAGILSDEPGLLFAPSAWTIAASADGRRAVIGTADGTVRVWDIEHGRPLRMWRGQVYQGMMRGHIYQIDAAAVSADGRWAITNSLDGMVCVWDLESDEPPEALIDREGRVDAVAISSDGSLAVTGGGDGVVRVWDLQHRRQLASFTADGEITCVAASPDADLVSAGTANGMVHLLRLVK